MNYGTITFVAKMPALRGMLNATYKLWRQFMRKNPLGRVLATLSGTLALILLLISCGGSNTPAPTAQQLIQNAQAAIQKVSSYHFNLKAQNIGTTSQLPIQSADGDIVVPDK